MTPSLDALLETPAAATEIPTEAIPRLLYQLASIEQILVSRLLNTTAASATTTTSDPDRLLTAEQAASLLSVTVKWLYRHARQLPFTRRLSRKTLRFSAAGLNKWLAQRKAQS